MEQQADYSTKKKTIFRTIKNQDHPFVMMDRRPIENDTLSWGAKGILAYLLSRPDNWTVRLKDLVNRSKDGTYKIRGYIRELKKAGHIHALPIRDDKTKRIIEYRLEVYELPFSTKPLTNLPLAGLPQAGNQMLNDNDSVNENESNNIKEVFPASFYEDANKTVDAILEAEKEAQSRKANGTGWEGRENFRPSHLAYADWYANSSGQVCKKKKMTDWQKAFSAWEDERLTIEDLQAAWIEDIKWRKVFTSPNQLTDKAVALKAQNKTHRHDATPIEVDAEGIPMSW